MTRMIVESEVDENGMLILSVPVGKDEAKRKVRITIEHVGEGTLPDPSRRANLRALVGAWQGGFEEVVDLSPDQLDAFP